MFWRSIADSRRICDFLIGYHFNLNRYHTLSSAIDEPNGIGVVFGIGNPIVATS
jgi:hypothetical protein